MRDYIVRLVIYRVFGCSGSICIIFVLQYQISENSVNNHRPDSLRSEFIFILTANQNFFFQTIFVTGFQDFPIFNNTRCNIYAVFPIISSIHRQLESFYIAFGDQRATGCSVCLIILTIYQEIEHNRSKGILTVNGMRKGFPHGHLLRFQWQVSRFQRGNWISIGFALEWICSIQVCIGIQCIASLFASGDLNLYIRIQIIIVDCLIIQVCNQVQSFLAGPDSKFDTIGRSSRKCSNSA